MLFEKVSMTSNIFSFFREHRGVFIEFLVNSNSIRSSKLVLRWFGKQIERCPSVPLDQTILLEILYELMSSEELNFNIL
jgi:hypothetical protein